MESQDKARSRRLWWNALAGLGLGILLVLATQKMPRLDWRDILVIAVAGIAVVFVHEAGHAAAAVLMRFRLVAFASWPLSFVRERQGWRVRLWSGGPYGFTA